MDNHFVYVWAVSRAFDEKHRLLAVWCLLTNVPESVDDATIENYFKLVKSAGLQLEEWQQAAERILRLLLIAGMACVTAWRLAADSSEEASAARGLLIRLSGRQMKRHRPFTEPGCWPGYGRCCPCLTS